MLKDLLEGYFKRLHQFYPTDEEWVVTFLQSVMETYGKVDSCKLPDLLWGELTTRMLGPKDDEGEKFTDTEQELIGELRTLNEKFQGAIIENVDKDDIGTVLIRMPLIYANYKKDGNAMLAYRLLEISSSAMYWGEVKGMGSIIRSSFLPSFQNIYWALYSCPAFLNNIKNHLRIQHRLNQSENRDGQMYEMFRTYAINVLCGHPFAEEWLEKGKLEAKKLDDIIKEAKASSE